jgi:hypothetical protein
MTQKEMMQLKVKNYDDLRDSLATSGLFDMTDCVVEIRCPMDSDVNEIKRMTNLIESMVHVTDVQVASTYEDLATSDYTITLTEDTQKFKRKFTTRK